MVSFTPPFAGSAVLHLVKSGNSGNMYEDFTTFTEVDTGNDRIQKIANHIDHLSYRNETTYLYKDYGVAHFGDFTHKIKVRFVSTSEEWSGGHTWLLANDVAGAHWIEDNNKTYISIFLLSTTGNSPRIWLREMYNGTPYDDTYTCSLNTWYYVKIVKSGTAINAYVYSDSDYSILLDTLTLTLHANHTLRYLYGCNSDNDGTGRYGTLDIENFNIEEVESPYEDFTAFTEVDVGADRIQKTAYHIDHLAYRNEVTYLYKDYGTAHFSDFEHKIKVRLDGTPVDYSYGVVWMLSNDLGATQDLRNANKSYINVFLYRVGSDVYTFLREVYNGTCYNDSNIVALHTNWRYIKIVKSGTSLTAYMYSDSDYSTLVDTLTLTMHVDGSYKYLFGCNTLNEGDTQSMATDVENFDIGGFIPYPLYSGRKGGINNQLQGGIGR